MSSVVNKKENSIVEIVFDISPEMFKDALNKSFQKNTKKFSIPGFRPGKAPMSLVTKYYGEGVLYDDAIEITANGAYIEAIEEHHLDPVSRPQIADITEIGSDKGIKFSILVTLKPDVTLGQYKGLEVVKSTPEITKEQIDAELDKVRERNARMIPVEDRTALTDDIVNIDYEGFLNGVAFEGGKGIGYDLKIGSGSFIPGFEEQVIGRALHDEFEIDVTFPEDYQKDELKGKAVVFKVKVNTIKIKELPVADDEFAKDVSEFNTLEEYTDSLRAKLMETAQKRADSEFENQIVGKAVENATVEIPDAMIESELDSMIEEQSQRMSYQGIELDQYLKYIGQDMEAFREGLKESAKTRAKTHLVIEAIGKAEGVEATSEEIDEEIKKIAEMYKMPEEDIRKQFGADSSYFSQDIIVRKTVELLKTEAKADAKAAKAEKKVKTEPKAKSDSKVNNEPKAKTEAKPKAKAKAKEEAKDEGKE